MTNPRIIATEALRYVAFNGHSAEKAWQLAGGTRLDGRDRGFARNIFLTSLRWFDRYAQIAQQLSDRALDNKLSCLIVSALTQIEILQTPAHAAVSETVNLTSKIGKPKARGFVNAILRRYLRERASLKEAGERDEVFTFSHPKWFMRAIQRDWPKHWQGVLAANNVVPETTLRLRVSGDAREALLSAFSDNGINFRAQGEASASIPANIDITKLPSYEAGAFVVQDTGAQLAAQFLSPEAGDRVLDACAAPGGKLCHLLDYQPNLKEIVGLDIDKKRITLIRENLNRLMLNAQLMAADATALGTWWDGCLFDKILLDAPCSGTGVIRKHPDIKQLRKASDIPNLQKQQHHLLDALWTCLKPGGVLLYSTCSVLRKENDGVITKFLNGAQDASVGKLDSPFGERTKYGVQILPGKLAMDGFYYCLLTKR